MCSGRWRYWFGVVAAVLGVHTSKVRGRKEFLVTQYLYEEYKGQSVISGKE
jgi:hypothetical protein